MTRAAGSRGTEASRRTNAESDLRETQQGESVREITVSIAHDLNNVLQVIVGNVEIIRMMVDRHGVNADAGGHAPQIGRAMDTAHRAAQNAKELVSRLLALHRQKPIAPAVHDINVLVRDTSAMIELVLGAKVRFETDLAPGPCHVHADRDTLRSMLLNLVTVAREAMPDGGTLSVETRRVDSHEGKPPGPPPGSYVTLCVRDTERGIAAQLYLPSHASDDGS